MMLAALLVLAAQQVPAQTPGQTAVARIVVRPENPTVVAGDSLVIRAEAVDSAGRAVPGAQVRCFGGSFEGGARAGSEASSCVVHGGSRGILRLSLVAIVQGQRPSRPQVLNVQIVPPPAARIAVEPAVNRMLAGQRLKLEARVFAANGDQREDEVRWTSSAPS
ncbi:MAG TPA: hypothetical protein VNL98_09780, partial [Gemmatimonadales bacterium]|nr:hypothetical protein [Gemmatimonadales bacterium]